MSDYNPDERVKNLINNRANEPEIVNQRQANALRNRPPLPHQREDEDDDDDSSSEYSFEESPDHHRQ